MFLFIVMVLVRWLLLVQVKLLVFSSVCRVLFLLVLLCRVRKNMLILVSLLVFSRFCLLLWMIVSELEFGGIFLILFVSRWCFFFVLSRLLVVFIVSIWWLVLCNVWIICVLLVMEMFCFLLLLLKRMVIFNLFCFMFYLLFQCWRQKSIIQG